MQAGRRGSVAPLLEEDAGGDLLFISSPQAAGATTKLDLLEQMSSVLDTSWGFFAGLCKFSSIETPPNLSIYNLLIMPQYMYFY